MGLIPKQNFGFDLNGRFDTTRMVTLYLSHRAKDYGYFCRAAIEFYAAADKSAWIVSDCRRKSDLRLGKKI